MSGMKDKAMGDYAPSVTPYQDFGRFRVVVNRQTGKVWIRDTLSSEAGQPYELYDVEAAIGSFVDRRF